MLRSSAVENTLKRHYVIEKTSSLIRSLFFSGIQSVFGPPPPTR